MLPSSSDFLNKLLTLLKDDGQLQVSSVEPFTELLLEVKSTEEMAISIAVLQRARDEMCLDIFYEIGGLRVMKFWLRKAFETNKNAQLQLILRFLKGAKLQENSTRRSGIMTVVNDLASNNKDPVLIKFSKQLLHEWDAWNVSTESQLKPNPHVPKPRRPKKEKDASPDTVQPSAANSRKRPRGDTTDDSKPLKTEKAQKRVEPFPETGVKQKKRLEEVSGSGSSKKHKVEPGALMSNTTGSDGAAALMDALYSGEAEVSIPPELLPPPPPTVAGFVAPEDDGRDENNLEGDDDEEYDPSKDYDDDEESTSKVKEPFFSSLPDDLLYKPSPPLATLETETLPPNDFSNKSESQEEEMDSPLMKKEGDDASDDELYTTSALKDDDSSPEPEEYNPFEDEGSPITDHTENKIDEDPQDQSDRASVTDKDEDTKFDIQEIHPVPPALKSAIRDEQKAQGVQKSIDWRDKKGKELCFFRLFDEFEPSNVYEACDSSKVQKEGEVHDKIKDLAKQEHLAEKKALQAEREAHSHEEEWFNPIQIIEPTVTWVKPERFKTPFAEMTSMITEEVRAQLQRIGTKQETFYSLPSQIPWTPYDPEGYLEIDEGEEEDYEDTDVAHIPLGAALDNAKHAFSEFRDLPGCLRDLDPIYLKFWVQNQDVFQRIILPNGQVDEEGLKMGINALKMNGLQSSMIEDVDEDGDMEMEDDVSAALKQEEGIKLQEWRQSSQGKELMHQAVQMMSYGVFQIKKSETSYGKMSRGGGSSFPTLPGNGAQETPGTIPIENKKLSPAAFLQQGISLTKEKISQDWDSSKHTARNSKFRVIGRVQPPGPNLPPPGPSQQQLQQPLAQGDPSSLLTSTQLQQQQGPPNLPPRPPTQFQAPSPPMFEEQGAMTRPHPTQTMPQQLGPLRPPPGQVPSPQLQPQQESQMSQQHGPPPMPMGLPHAMPSPPMQGNPAPQFLPQNIPQQLFGPPVLQNQSHGQQQFQQQSFQPQQLPSPKINPSQSQMIPPQMQAQHQQQQLAPHLLQQGPNPVQQQQNTHQQQQLFSSIQQFPFQNAS